MFDSPVDEIKNRLDIIDVISGYVKLKKAGKDHKALCPFHSEKTPSFFVSPSKQIWHCFGCGAGNDMFGFVMQIEGVEFADALRILAKKAGVILKKQDPELQSQRSKLYEICQETAEFFEENLKGTKEVQDYLKKRGISSKSIKEFRIGYALDSWDSLYKHLTDLGYKTGDIEKAGLIIQKSSEQRTPSHTTGQVVNSERRKYYDRFRKRIMFPICDISGQVIGFTGRIFKGDESTAKYINSPETLIFNKSQVLYALDKAKVDIRKKDQCILVEGQIDVVMSYQTGVNNIIATSGTALTPDHLRIIKRYTDNLLLAFDTDTAGEAATKKSIGLAQGAEFNIRIIIFPKEEDPADIIKENPKAWRKATEDAQPIMEFYFENAFSKYNLKKVEDKRKIAQELLPSIKRIANEIERAHWLQVLAAKLNVQEKLLNEALNKVKSQEERMKEPAPIKATASKKSRLENLEQDLLGFVLKYPEHLNCIKKNLRVEHFTNPTTQKIFQELKNQKKGKKINLPDQPYYIDHIIFQIEHYDLGDKDIIKEINFCIKEIKSNYLKKKLSEMSLAIKGAEKEGDKKKVKKLMEEFNKLSKELVLL
jgi:DNA primase